MKRDRGRSRFVTAPLYAVPTGAGGDPRAIDDATRRFLALARWHEGCFGRPHMSSRTLLASWAGAVAALSAELLDIDRALTKLEGVSPRLAQVVEWRFFGGMTEDEAAAALGVTVRTVRRDWQKARAFLFHELRG